jgi:uncharacterized protein with HEPN domain
MRRDSEYLHDIYLAACDLYDAVGGLDLDTFARLRMRQHAVKDCLLEIGEASKKISPEFKGQHTLIPWDEFVTRRNRLAHEYFRMDLGEMWHVAQNIIPGLIEYLKPLVLKSSEQDDS